MPTVRIKYEGTLRTASVHEGSGATIRTDAPVDNHGLGQGFSPTDLLATALGTCMITVMGIKAESKGWVLNSVSCDVVKVMQSAPRRVARLEVTINMPAKLEQEQRDLLEKIALSCPVAKSLSAELEQDIRFKYEG